MKPVGLRDPDGRRPWAVVQLRREDLAKSQFNLVGFQSRMRWGDQERVLRLIPGLEGARFVRLGQIHRNTFINAPTHLDAHYRVKTAPNVRLAGQITGVEGYLESAATGLAVGLYLALERAGGRAPEPFPPTTALGRPRPPPHRVRPPALPARQRQLRPLRRAAQRAAPRRPAGGLRRAGARGPPRLGGAARGVGGSGVRRLIHRFLEHLGQERGLSRHTLRAYEGDLLRFLDFLARDFLARAPETIQPQEIDALAVRSFLAAETRRGLGRRSQGRALAAIRSLFRFACREGTLGANPASGVRTPKHPHTLPRHLRPGEVENLIEAPAGGEPLVLRDRAIVELLYATGLRVGELVGLDWPDVDLGGRVLRVTGKGGKERMVPFGRPAAEALRAWLQVWEGLRAGDVPGEPVFLNSSRRPAHRPLGAPRPRPLGGGGGRRRRCPPAHPAPHLRHPPAGGRGRPARDPGAARPQLALDHPEVHPPRRRAPPRGLPRGPSAGPRWLTGR